MQGEVMDWEKVGSHWKEVNVKRHQKMKAVFAGKTRTFCRTLKHAFWQLVVPIVAVGAAGVCSSWWTSGVEIMNFTKAMCAVGAVMCLGMMLQMLQLMQVTKRTCENISERCSFMEKRMQLIQHDAAGASRDVGELMKTYDEDIGEQTWLQRGLREVAGNWNQPMKTWRLLCSEVMLRHCRDALVERLGALAHADGGGVDLAPVPFRQTDGDKMQERLEILGSSIQKVKDWLGKSGAKDKMKAIVHEVAMKQEKVMDNLKIFGMNFWHPWRSSYEMANAVKWTIDGGAEPCEDLVLQDQLVERKLEICDYMRQQLKLMGMPLEGLVEHMPRIMKEWYVEMQNEGNNSGQCR